MPPPTRTPAPTKVCKDCGVEKPRDEFHGRELRCKECARPTSVIRSRVRRAKEREAVPARRNGEMGRIPKSSRTAQGSQSGTTLAMNASVRTIASTPPSAILARAATEVRETGWVEGVLPDVFRCLITSTGITLDDRLAHVSGEGWERRRFQDVYLPRGNVEKYLHAVTGNKAARESLARITDYLTEAAGWDDLDTWSQQYSTGPEDVVDVFERAAQLAESRDD